MRTAGVVARTLDEYVDNLRQFVETRRARDFVAGNVYAEKLGIAAAKLRHEFGNEGRRALVNVMSDEELLVRNIAATHCLDFESILAESVLREVIEKDRFEGPMAQWILDEWRSGRKDFPGGPI